MKQINEHGQRKNKRAWDRIAALEKVAAAARELFKTQAHADGDIMAKRALRSALEDLDKLRGGKRDQ